MLYKNAGLLLGSCLLNKQENVMLITISIIITFSIGFFIVYELLKQLGFYRLVFEIIYTHPQFDRLVRVFGLTAEGIAISVVGAAVYQWFLDGKIIYSAFLFGIMWIIFGAILKEYGKK